MRNVESLEDLLILEIGDLLSAEQQLVEALPEMAKASTSKELRSCLLDHLKETEKQLQRLERAAEILEMKSSDGHACKAMKGLLAEGREALKSIPAGPLRDAAIIGSAQRVEHYEMAAYGTARAFAEQLEETDIVRLLSETYKEEMAADQLLTKVSARVNAAALEQNK